MARDIIVVGGSWVHWEWYALNRHTQSIANIGYLGPDDGKDLFYHHLGHRSCRPSDPEGFDKKSWIKEQDIILLRLENEEGIRLWQEEEIDHALKNFWFDGGIILAEYEAAGALFASGVNRQGKVFRGLEFLQGLYCPQYEKWHKGILPQVMERDIPSGYGAESWAGLHFRGRHLLRGLQIDETSLPFRLRDSGAEEIDADLVSY